MLRSSLSYFYLARLSVVRVKRSLNCFLSVEISLNQCPVASFFLDLELNQLKRKGLIPREVTVIGASFKNVCEVYLKTSDMWVESDWCGSSLHVWKVHVRLESVHYIDKLWYIPYLVHTEATLQYILKVKIWIHTLHHALDLHWPRETTSTVILSKSCVCLLFSLSPSLSFTCSVFWPLCFWWQMATESSSVSLV